MQETAISIAIFPMLRKEKTFWNNKVPRSNDPAASL